MEISPVIYRAIDILKNSLGGIDIELLSDQMYRKYGMLGVTIEFMGIKSFLGLQTAEDILIYGQKLADRHVKLILNTAYAELT